MNKFALAIFVILAIELPSIFGCNTDMVHLLQHLDTTTTTTTPTTTTALPDLTESSDFQKLAKENEEQLEYYLTSGYPTTFERRKKSIDVGGNVFELELEGFSICNTDGTEGLTFNEIEACQVNYNL